MQRQQQSRMWIHLCRFKLNYLWRSKLNWKLLIILIKVNPVQVISHLEEESRITFARFSFNLVAHHIFIRAPINGLPTHRVKRSFGPTNPIVLKLSGLAGPYASLVLKAAKIFCKITGPGIFCWKYVYWCSGWSFSIELPNDIDNSYSFDFHYFERYCTNLAKFQCNYLKVIMVNPHTYTGPAKALKPVLQALMILQNIMHRLSLLMESEFWHLRCLIMIYFRNTFLSVLCRILVLMKYNINIY